MRWNVVGLSWTMRAEETETRGSRIGGSVPSRWTGVMRSMRRPAALCSAGNRATDARHKPLADEGEIPLW